MKCNGYIALGFSVLLNTAIMATLVSPAAHAETAGFEPIWSDSSKTVNSSTQALASGNTAAAISRAEAALSDENLAYTDRIIASHNLCVALALQNPDKAKPHCLEVVEAPASLVVKPSADGLKLRSGRTVFVPSIKAQSMTLVMLENMRQVKTGPASQIAESKTPRK